MEPSRNIRRQPAWHVFASEFGEATLNEKGSGEYDPSFVITRLGAKVNRCLVAGLLERVEARETSSGQTMYQGQLRDPSGLMYFSVGDYDPESARESILGLSRALEEGETMHVMMVAKARWYQTDEGAIYTSLRPEEVVRIDPSRYSAWLARTANATLARLDAYERSQSVVSEGPAAMKEAGIPEHLIPGLSLALPHYDGASVEQYRLHVLQALDIAEGRMDAVRSEPTKLPVHGSEEGEGDGEGAASGGGSDDASDTMKQLIATLDQGQGVDYETLIRNMGARGFDAGLADTTLDALFDEGSILEPNFGWYRLVE
ncbi:MAG TPA: hypothetical protein HA276_04985 [Candidatus Poseidoniaceae archaeon]|nr:hypothetical protein [Candidatus Poseidoniaceae archaeon]HII97029.1 hypothetical protein [Candidatus Poseidoniaceae archaeon]|tara:strand:- start:9273 stop:10220 length:948 start_codon:yes stop_codon:yes gene_type:complete